MRDAKMRNDGAAFGVRGQVTSDSQHGTFLQTGQISMAAKKTTSSTKKAKTVTKKHSSSSHRARVAGIADDDEKVPNLTVTVKMRKKGKRGRPQKWDRDKLMAYVCEKMSNGGLVIQIARRIGITCSKIYDIADTTDTYRSMFARARKKQAAWFGENVNLVAAGQDRLTLKERKRIAKLRKGKNLGDQMYANVRENGIYQRNRLQLDGAKWYAKVTDPERFGDKSSVALSGDETGAPIGITLRFVDGKGKDVTP